MPTSRLVVLLLPILAVLGLAAPAAAQFSDRYNFFKAVKESDALKVKTIIDQPGSTFLNMRNPETGDMALHMVTRRRDVEWMNFLMANRADVNVRDQAGNTPLMVAAQLGFVDGIQALVRRNANVNLANNRGETPLIVAVQLRNAFAARELLAAGANPDQTDNVAGKSARDYALADRRAAGILRMIENNDRKDEGPATTPTG